MMPRLDFAATAEADADIADLVIRVWKSGQDTMAMAKAIRVRAEVMGEPVPHLSAAQAHAHNVLALYRDTIHALRQREATHA